MSDPGERDSLPWVPEGARPFQQGDSVQIRLGGECRYRCDLGHEVANGYSGKVKQAIDPDTIRLMPFGFWDPSHPIAVELDDLREWFPHKGQPYRAIFNFAPSELELLEPAKMTPTAHQRHVRTRSAPRVDPNTPTTTQPRRAVDSAGEGA